MTATDADLLYAAILAHPDEDTPRLAWADCLDERGEPGDAERAEFVRVQCQLDPMRKRFACVGGIAPRDWKCECVGCVLQNREHELLAKHGSRWRRSDSCSACGGTGKGFGVFLRGQTIDRSRNRTMTETWGPGRCPACHGNGYTGTLAEMREYQDSESEYGRTWRHPVTWERGLPASVTCSLADYLREWTREKCNRYPEYPHCLSHCPDCGGSGTRPVSWAESVVREWPVVRFVLTCREPTQHTSGAWMWVRDTRAEPGGIRDELPAALFDALEPPDALSPFHVFGLPGDWRTWKTSDDANRALASAAGQLARRRWYSQQHRAVGVCPLSDTP